MIFSLENCYRVCNMYSLLSLSFLNSTDTGKHIELASVHFKKYERSETNKYPNKLLTFVNNICFDIYLLETNAWYSCSPKEGETILKRLQRAKVVINGTFHSKIILMAFSILTIGILGKGEAKNWHPLWSSFVREREKEKKRNELVDGPVGLRFELGYSPSSCSYQFMYTTIKSFPLFLSRDIRSIIYNLVSLSKNSFMLSQSSKILQRNAIIDIGITLWIVNQFFDWN